jgi:hypothetical protein
MNKPKKDYIHPKKYLMIVSAKFLQILKEFGNFFFNIFI